MREIKPLDDLFSKDTNGVTFRKEFEHISSLSEEDYDKYGFSEKGIYNNTLSGLNKFYNDQNRDIEKNNPKLHLNSLYPVPVHDPTSLLVNRMEDYYELSINLHHSWMKPINWLDMDLMDRIINNNPYPEDADIEAMVEPYPVYRNIIINWLNRDTSDSDSFSITKAELNSLENLNYVFSKDLFYEIPIILYIIKAYATGMQTTPTYESDYSDYIKSETCYGTGD